MAEKVKEIVITGGPCGGKTLAVAFLAQRLRSKGFRVFAVPEMATLVISNGVPDISMLEKYDSRKYWAVEEQMLRLHLAMRDIFLNLAETFSGERRVIIYDRAAMDVAAYMPRIKFENLMKNMGLDREVLLSIYYAVFHMVTAAKGAKDFYGTTGNEARREGTIEEAKRADDKILTAWNGHRRLRVIDNWNNSFDRKLERLWIEVCEVLGIPS